MTAYRAGQRVRIEGQTWAVEGVLFAGPKGRLFVDMPGDDYEWPVEEWATSKGVSITVLSEPRPDEPTGLGAVVEASLDGFGFRRRWLRTFEGYWCCEEPITAVSWVELVDPVVLSDGWAP